MVCFPFCILIILLSFRTGVAKHHTSSIFFVNVPAILPVNYEAVRFRASTLTSTKTNDGQFVIHV